MIDVKCPVCNKKLGVVDEKKYSVVFEEGVKELEPHASIGLVVFPFECPICLKNHVQVLTIKT